MVAMRKMLPIKCDDHQSYSTKSRTINECCLVCDYGKPLSMKAVGQKSVGKCKRVLMVKITIHFKGHQDCATLLLKATFIKSFNQRRSKQLIQ